MDRTLLTAEERTALAEAHPDWEVGDTQMRREVKLTDFSEAMGFVTRVAIAAEALDHHPDIDIRWNTVKLVLSTHSEGGLTALDRELAGRIDSYL